VHQWLGLAVGVIIPIVGQEMVQSAHQNAGSAQPPLERLTQQKHECSVLVKWKTQFGTGFFCIHHSMASHYGMDCSSPTTGRPTGDFDLFGRRETSKPRVPWLSMQGMCRKWSYAIQCNTLVPCFGWKSAFPPNLHICSWYGGNLHRVMLDCEESRTFTTLSHRELGIASVGLLPTGIWWDNLNQTELASFVQRFWLQKSSMLLWVKNLDTCSRGVILFPPHQGHPQALRLSDNARSWVQALNQWCAPVCSSLALERLW
jgi:hypothetical protein